MPNPKKPRTNCPVCGKEPAKSFYKYCSNACQQKYQYEKYIQDWKAGKIAGLQSLGIVSPPIKRYLREKFGNKCCFCGWSKINQKTGRVPLVADYIDGNWRNNAEPNLRLVCPNCDSLLPTFSALNKGKGREHRAISKRSLEAREFVKNYKPM
ncbi:MAG: endonuclease [Parcubacteria group bacterium]|nr:endonuclease [Parcubacteria group bacterium]